MYKIELEKEKCIGCGACIAIDSDNFEFDEDGYSVLKNETVENVTEELKSAKESCPVDAIDVKEENND